LITKGITEGVSSIPHIYTVLKFAPWLLLIVALKYYFGGARNESERLMHSKVVMVTVC
jgi:small-conductance mechanosensitive channel